MSDASRTAKRGMPRSPSTLGTVTRHAPSHEAGLEKADTLEEAIELVRQHGGRVTASRRLLLHALFATPGHRTAEELALEVQAEDPDIHISTIYRNLEELERLGIVVHSHFGHGPATYHLASSVHGHLVCEQCGTLIEAPDSLFNGLAKAAHTQFGFVIDPHHFALLGRCVACTSLLQNDRLTPPA
jgi:Fur family transcriptional regulator, ferric uptake regulator